MVEISLSIMFFVIGIVIGSIATYIILRRKYERLLRHTIDDYERLLCLALDGFEGFFPLPTNDHRKTSPHQPD